MKANKFVKKFGLEDAREYLCGASFWEIGGTPITPYVNDLKRLVESHKLVESYGGLENAKDEYFSCVQNHEPASHIARAIADVESCM